RSPATGDGLATRASPCSGRRGGQGHGQEPKRPVRERGRAGRGGACCRGQGTRATAAGRAGGAAPMAPLARRDRGGRRNRGPGRAAGGAASLAAPDSTVEARGGLREPDEESGSVPAATELGHRGEPGQGDGGGYGPGRGHQNGR